jgi:hypothetical protein
MKRLSSATDDQELDRNVGSNTSCAGPCKIASEMGDDRLQAIDGLSRKSSTKRQL